jgi:uracil-DNA glycosylase family 4
VGEHDELDALELIREARGWLEWEGELGSPGVKRPRGVSVAPAASTVGRPQPVASVAASQAAEPISPSIVGLAAAARARTAPIPDRRPLDETRARLLVLAERAATCTACQLHEGRTKSVFARGNPAADLAFVGEGPGFNEDQQGEPFVGDAGALLDKMVAAIGYQRDAVYVCNVVKCRPPENRTPTPDEALACSPYLIEQLELVRPRVIVALGRTATEGLGLMPASGSWRGNWTQWRGIDVMPTYHPAYLLRTPDQKRVVWEDLKRVMARLGEPPR